MNDLSLTVFKSINSVLFDEIIFLFRSKERNRCNLVPEVSQTKLPDVPNTEMLAYLFNVVPSSQERILVLQKCSRRMILGRPKSSASSPPDIFVKFRDGFIRL